MVAQATDSPWIRTRMAGLAREDLSHLPRRPLAAARNRTKADVILVESGRENVVVKDFRARGFIVRHTIGRFSIARECRAYARLESIPGIPAFHGRIDPFAFACEYIPGRPLRGCSRRSQPAALFTALDRLLESVHARGVAIADLHHRNVLGRDTDGAPFLVDFSLAVVRPVRWNFPGRWIFARALELDRLAFERIRARYAATSGPPTGTLGSPGTEDTEHGDRARSTGTETRHAGASGAGGRNFDAVVERALRRGEGPAGARSQRSTDLAHSHGTPPRFYRLGRSIKSWIRRARGKS